MTSGRSKTGPKRAKAHSIAVGELVAWLSHALTCSHLACDECERIARRVAAHDFGDAHAVALTLARHDALQLHVVSLLDATTRAPSPARTQIIARALDGLRAALTSSTARDSLPPALRERLRALDNARPHPAPRR